MLWNSLTSRRQISQVVNEMDTHGPEEQFNLAQLLLQSGTAEV